MADLPPALGEPRLRSPSPGRGGRFDDGGRRSPPPPSDRWPGNGIDRPASGHGAPTYRSRSPDFGRKRRRDDSPPSRDRYIPNYEREPPRERERKDLFHSPNQRDRGGRYAQNPDTPEDYRRGGSAFRDDAFTYSPDRGHPNRGSKHGRTSHLVPPSELSHLVNFRYFADFMRINSPHIAEDKDRLAEQWKRYRQDFTHKLLVAFFEENNTKPWFREKYLPAPEFEEMRQRLRRKGCEGKVEKFTQKLLQGAFDIVNYDYLPLSRKFTNLGKTMEPVVENGAEAGKLDPPINLNNGPSPNHDTQSSAKSGVEPEISEPPAAATAEARSDDQPPALDVEGEEYPDPDDEFNNSIVDAVAGANLSVAPPSDLGSLIGESMKGKSGSDDIVILPPSENQLFIKSISPDISRAELENHCKQVEGFDYLALSDPHTGKKLHRVGWVSFVPGTDMKAAENALSESKINNFTLHMMRAERPAFQKLRLCPGIMNTPERISKDLTQARKLAVEFENMYFQGALGSQEKRGSVAIDAKVQAMKDQVPHAPDDAPAASPKQNEGSRSGTPGNHHTTAADAEGQSSLMEEQSLLIEKKALDLYLYYLRTVFNSCYYCVCVCDFQEELLRRCAKHVRKPAPLPFSNEVPNGGTPQGSRRSGQSSSVVSQRANEVSWAKTLDERLSLLLAKSEVDPREFGGERIDDEIHRLCQPQITDEGAGKFRCKNCSKLFKAMNFIEKHIMTKHGEVINQDTVERIKYLNSYILDPSHTTPQPASAPDSQHTRSNNTAGNPMNPMHGMMAGNMPPSMPTPHEYHASGFPGMMGPMTPASMMMGGPYGGYPPAIYAGYPGHAYSHMGGPPMFPNGSMVGGPPGAGAPPGPYGHQYFMNPMGHAGYPAPYQPAHHQVYSSLPAIPAMAQGRIPSNGGRRLGDRISRNFADDYIPPGMPHEGKRNRRGMSHDRAMGNSVAIAMSAVPSDPRSKTVLAYNDLDTPAGDEIVLNY